MTYPGQHKGELEKVAGRTVGRLLPEQIAAWTAFDAIPRWRRIKRAMRRRRIEQMEERLGVKRRMG